MSPQTGYHARMDAEMSPAPAPQGTSVASRAGDVLRGAAWGAVGAMAMTGMRVITTELGLVQQTPPQALKRQRARGVRALLRRAPRTQRRGLVEAAHWAFGPVRPKGVIDTVMRPVFQAERARWPMPIRSR